MKDTKPRQDPALTKKMMGETAFVNPLKSGGNKKDEGKLRYDLIPADVEEEIARVFTFGATKYGDRNWESGIKYSRLVAAARRHLASYLLGNQTDEECGTHHLANAIVNLMMIVHFDKLEISDTELNDLKIKRSKA